MTPPELKPAQTPPLDTVHRIVRPPDIKNDQKGQTAQQPPVKPAEHGPAETLEDLFDIDSGFVVD